MKTIVLSLICLAISVQCAPASITGVIEDFSALGEYNGFHHPDWIPRGEFSLNAGALSVSHDQNQAFFFGRFIQGRGSFRTILEFSEVVLHGNDNPVSATGLSLSHQLRRPNNGGVGAILTDDGEGQWELRTGTSTSERVDRSRSTPVRITLTMEFPSNEYYVTYDNAANDRIPAREFGPFVYNRDDISDFQWFDLGTYADKERTSMSAKLDYLSILPLDAAPGDFSGDGELDLDDLEMMTRATRIDRVDSLFDLDGDTRVDANDIAFWVRELGYSYIGDANLDGEFNSSDLVLVFNAGEYEDDVSGASIWYSGDWNGDGDFTTADLVFAFQDAGYELGPRPASHTVPEPDCGGIACFFALVAMLRCCWPRRHFVRDQRPSG